MIFYYTASKKTKVFAEALRDILNLPLYELKSKLNEKKAFGFMMHALYLAVTGKTYPVSNMPEKIEGGEIYLCAPVWGGNAAGPAWFFLNNAELKNVKVNLLLTCGSAVSAEKYRKKGLESLRLADCVPGDVYVFITGNTDKLPEPDIAAEHIREMLP